MRIHNIRMGFATNSSSSHSLIFLKNAKESLEEGYDFGWDYFTATKKKTRRIYLGHLIAVSLREVMDHRTIPTVVKELVGSPVDHDWGHLDHQSVYMIPLNWQQNGPDYEFIEDLKEFFLQKDLVILGGNDNVGYKHPLDDGKTFVLPLPRDDRSSGWIARKDPQGFWTLFNCGSGNKIRFSFPTPKNPGEVKYNEYHDRSTYGHMTPNRSHYPELIDIKITDFCSKGCRYCYQDSDATGRHAEIDYSVYFALKDMKVFEVALGGGEPLGHPKFVDILRSFRYYNIVPNFSTKRLDWLSDPILSHRILNGAGSFAYSTQDVEELVTFASICKVQGIREKYSIKPTVHYIMGMEEPNLFKKFLETADSLGVHVVLLGFKPVGRGRAYRGSNLFIKYDYWLGVIQELRDSYSLPNLSIDTVIASEYDEQLRAAGVDQIMYHTEEGRFSMYIDLVNNKMGPSSFCNEDEMLDLRVDYAGSVKDQIVEAFNSF